MHERLFQLGSVKEGRKKKLGIDEHSRLRLQCQTNFVNVAHQKTCP